MASDPYAGTAARFAKDVAGHQMVVLRDDGLYRHLRFTSRPAGGYGEYWFDLITWPGYLTICGDMDTFTLARTRDMFEFFRSRYGINPRYWAEKARAVPRDGMKAYDERLFRRHVFEAFSDAVRGGYAPAGLAQAIRDEVLGSSETGFEQGAHEVLRDFKFDGFRFESSWEWDLTDWTYQFLWCCHAIQWGIGVWDRRGVQGWNADKPHRCPLCHAVAIDLERPSPLKVYTCCRCEARFARWPRMARLLPKAGVMCSEHREPKESADGN